MKNEKRLIDTWKLVIDLARLNKCGSYDHENVLAVIASQKTVDAVEVNRLGKLGRLMMPYKGDPRGNMGARGCSGEDFRAIELDPITDVDGNRWIPVLEEDLCAMKARADDTVKVVHGRWIETLVPDGYAQKASRLRKQCSVCGWTNACRYNYCPNCGADMRERKDNGTV